jgi:hypothetical protein
MPTVAVLLSILALASCTADARRDEALSPCVKSEASYECQVERYRNVNAN